MENIRFATVHDQSIVSGQIYTNKKKTKVVRKCLLAKFDELSEISYESNYISIGGTEYQPANDRYQVYLRIKPTSSDLKSNGYTIENNNKMLFARINVPQGRTGKTYRNDVVMNKYLFDYIFDQQMSQEKIFNQFLKPHVFNFINGHDCTIMTYGASGSGKTHTILGDMQQPGLIPRTLEYLFRSLSNIRPTLKPLSDDNTATFLTAYEANFELEKTRNILCGMNSRNIASNSRSYSEIQQRLSDQQVPSLSDHSTIFSVWVSFFEIYNEQIFDLLTPGKEKVKTNLALNKKDHPYVKKLTHLYVCNGEEAYQLLQFGIDKLNYASTSVNSHSSRSHSIFTIHLLQGDPNSQYVQSSSFNLCDLAGSERVKNTENKGARLKESGNINTSLHILGRCLHHIHDSQRNKQTFAPPYRESKLTMYFKDALSGQQPITMIVTINPDPGVRDITQHVLNFAALARKIIVVPKETTRMRRLSKFADYIKKTNLSNNTSAVENVSQVKDRVILPENDSHVENLLEEISYLKQCVEMLEKQMLERETQVRHEVCDEYNQLMENVEKRWQKRLADAVENTKRLCRSQMNMDDDDDDEEELVEDYKTNYNYLKEHSEKHIKLLESKLEEKSHENLMLKKRVEELEQICQDAKIDYETLVRDNNEIIKELLRTTLKGHNDDDDNDDESISFDENILEENFGEDNLLDDDLCNQKNESN